MNNSRIITLAAVSLLAAGCQSASYNTPGPTMPQQSGIEGQWVDPNGIVSSFHNGRFETRTTDSNSLLAQGSYSQASSNLVQIEMTSLVRNTTSRVNCALVNPTQLNCTSSTGAQFSLVRRT